MWLAYSELLLSIPIACIYSLFLLWNVLPVCPMYTYFNGSLSISFDICHFCYFIMFCIVFRVLNAVLICESLNSFVIFLVSFPLYVKLSHFVFRCCGSMSVFCFCGAGCFLILCIL
jgi:hypothetical protein